MARTLLIAIVLVAVALGFAYYWYKSEGSQERDVERLAAATGLGSHMTVAEVGAGEGKMAVQVARRLQLSGRIIATELEESKLSAIRRNTMVAGLKNLEVIKAGVHESNLPAGCCDVVYMRRVYHHLSDPASINRDLLAALRPGGRLVIMDFVTPAWIFWASHGMPASGIVEQIRQAGFALEKHEDLVPPLGYMLVFRKPPGV